MSGFVRALALACALAVSSSGCADREQAKRPDPASPVLDAELTDLVEAAARRDGPAMARLRAAGPRGLSALLRAYDASEGDRRDALSDAVDRVARQKDARASRLFWHTDLESAKAAARASGRPILSLRLLGQLDDELSCANSRFFRIALYPSHEVNALLRDRFVLHWSTERPAPIVTIDFRDGRTIRRTVTGNSLHYVLDREGRVVDAIPGLLGPAAFASALSQAEGAARQLGSLDGDARAEPLARYHERSLAALRGRWSTAFARAGLPPRPFLADAVAPPAPSALPPPAMVAMNVAPSKARVEAPILGRAMPPPVLDVTGFVDTMPWKELAISFAEESRLDATTRALVRDKRPRSWTDASSPGRPLTDAELEALVQSFERSMAEDTAKNTLLHHAVLHRWLADAAKGRTGDDAFATLNARVYADLFKTPASDPWLGLVPPLAFSGIADDGIAR